jgi:hypothetical protein
LDKKAGATMKGVEERWAYLTPEQYQVKVERAANEIERMEQRGENVETKDLVQLQYWFGVPWEYVPRIVRDAQALLQSRVIPTDTELDMRKRYLGG